MSGNKGKLIAFNYFGGKFTYADYLYQYFPQPIKDIQHFVDVFCGSMVVTLNKPFSKIDTANDINDSVVNFFKVLREKPNELITLLKLTPVSRSEYDRSWMGIGCEKDELEWARKFYVRVRQSYFGLGIQRNNKGWHMAKTQSCTSKGETVSKWINSIDKLPLVVDKLTNIQIENKDFRKLIPDMDFEGAFFYCDPPYPIESRSGKNDYLHDFEDEDHIDLAGLLNNITGRVMISGYDCPLMQELYKDWVQVKFPIKKNNMRSTISQECIWMNYDPKTVNRQTELFQQTTNHEIIPL